jgi:hypothetical protein
MINPDKYNNFNRVDIFPNIKGKGLVLLYEDTVNTFEKDQDAHYQEIIKMVEEELNDKSKEI